MFAPLHTKSEYSLGYGVAPVEDLVRRVAALGYPAVALTDLENLYGQVRFHDAARAYGVRPVTGVELRTGQPGGPAGSKKGRLVLLARDEEGYESLCRIVTRRRGERPDPRGSDPLAALEELPRGVFHLSDDPDVVEWLLASGVPAEEIRFLLVRPGGRPAPPGVRSVADPDVVMLARADAPLHELLLAIRSRSRVGAVEGVESPERILPSPDDLAARYENAPDALEESLRVAEACSLDLLGRAPALPSPALEPGETAEGRLDRVVRERFESGRARGRWRGTAHAARLDHELERLASAGLARYVLLVGAIAEEARRRGIEIVGRGSAASSLALHVMGVTPVDPVAHGLLFERFVHARRAEPPDIDLDLPSERRDELLAWVFRRFGEDRAAMVAAHQTFRRRSAFREGLKALGMAAADVARFAERIPDEDLDETAVPIPLHLLPEPYRSRAPLLRALIGRPHHLSVHAGGVVIAEPRLDRYTPLERAPKGVRVTQYDMHSLERLGLVKVDLLGNRALSALAAAAREAGRALEAPEDDPATARRIREARTIGCFQIETPVLRATLRRLPIRSARDLVAALAIVRPGPASGEAKAAFLRRAAGRERPEPPHPRLAERLRETYGMMLYEEDLIAALSALTGWTLEESDAMRSALVRAGEDEVERAPLREGFLHAAASAGIAEAESSRVWRELTRFAAYSFNKAHASSYALLAWRTAFARTHEPAAYACGVLDHYGGHYPLRTVAADFAREGVVLLLPHVNRSAPETRLEAGAVRLGLGRVKDLSRAGLERLLEARPFRDLPDLLTRARPSARELGALVRSGACDGLAPLDPEAYPFAHEEALRRAREGGPPSREALGRAEPRSRDAEALAIYRSLVRVRNELRYLEMHVTDHPMRVLRGEAARAGCVPMAELPGRAGEAVRVAGLVAAARRLLTRGGGVMQFVTIEDEHGLLEALLPPAALRRLRDPVTNPGPFLFEGTLEGEGGDLHLVVERAIPFHERPRPYAPGHEGAGP